MIIKFQEINKIKLEYNLYLFYGKNDGLKNEIINKIVKNKGEISTLIEKDVLDNFDIFFQNILSKSLFENEKIIIIKRATDKIIKVIEEIDQRNIEDVTIIVNSDNLEKKSKLRAYFEKHKSFICCAFYPDNDQTLSQLALDFFKKNKISISHSNINQVITKCNGDRHNLFNELEKLKNFCKNGKKLNSKIISQLINLTENHSILELVNNCLAKNKKKTLFILNENNFSNDDSITILRIFLDKLKKNLKLSYEYENNKNISLTISSARPPIFWKDIEITKKQIQNWNSEKLKLLIYKVNEIELNAKKNINNSVNLISDFLLEQSTVETNSLI